MPQHIRPKATQWYYDTIEDRQFEVLYADEDEDLIEIHFKEGQTEELDYAAWAEKELKLIAAPDDWSDFEKDDAEDDADEDEDWSSFSEIDPDEEEHQKWNDDDK